MADESSARDPRRDRTAAAVVGLAALALLVRLVGLGSRVAHWDEGRIGYAVLRYADTGAWTYDPALHGPFLFHVNEFLFGLLGPTDFAARLVVALVGGALPLAALLFRSRLADDETVAFALFLALNPVLLYYSRFMRNDVLVAGFMVFALGFLVRAYDRGSAWHLYAGALALGLGLTTKENALLYLLAWVGGGLLLLDGRVLRATEPAASADGGEPAGTEDATADADGAATDPVARLREAVTTRADDLRYWSGPVMLAAVEVVLVLVLFYAPRGDAGATLGNALADPTLLPAVVDAALADTWDRVGFWTSGAQLSHPYISWLVYYVRTLAVAAAPVTVLAVAGFVADRYADDGPRDLVALGAYWAGASLVFYPIVSATKAAWTLVHVVVPLALPAAVGLALVYRWGATSLAEDSPLRTAVAAILIVAVVLGTVGAGVQYAHVAPQSADNPMVQYGQPAGELRGTLDDATAAAGGSDGVGVLYYGEFFHVDNESRAASLPVRNVTDDNGVMVENNGNWYHRLPLPWYFEAAGAESASVAGTAAFNETLAEESPPVVVARANATDAIEGSLDGYDAHTHELTAPGTEIVVYVDRAALNEST
ncbi:flippase activity-associated protein Agl23 [Halostella litorea]|uniref:flippase activity-associated protein Agl23 n=1 Tax=Halostella litorea TaxID=2528831 RepID=UPI0010927E34|nr:flippase activity-associated protein Agl23 [Halostella litorea]